MTSSRYLRLQAPYVENKYKFGKPVPDFLLAFYSNFCRIFNRFRVITVTSFGWDFLFPAIFWGVFGANDPQDMGFGQCDPQKAHPYAKPRRLSHQPRKSVQQFGLGAITRKKNWIDTYIHKKIAHLAYISPLRGGRMG